MSIFSNCAVGAVSSACTTSESAITTAWRASLRGLSPGRVVIAKAATYLACRSILIVAWLFGLIADSAAFEAEIVQPGLADRDHARAAGPGAQRVDVGLGHALGVGMHAHAGPEVVVRRGQRVQVVSYWDKSKGGEYGFLRLTITPGPPRELCGEFFTAYPNPLALRDAFRLDLDAHQVATLAIT